MAKLKNINGHFVESDYENARANGQILGYNSCKAYDIL